MSTRNPGLDDVIETALEERMSDLYIALPGVVQAYDATTQKVSVAPSAKVAHTDEDGRRVVQALPVVTGVPVMFPGGGGFTVTFPIAVGDTVLLVFANASLDKWKSGAGGSGAVDPEFYSRHPISDAIAIPGLRNFRNARSSVPTDHVRIGVDGAAAQGAALGDVVKGVLDGIRTIFNAHTHTCPAGTSAPPATPVSSVPTIASATVKVTS